MKNYKYTPYDYASIHLYPYLALHNVKVDPMYRYDNKLFLGLCDYFNDFIEDKNKRILLLETSPRTGKTDFILNVVVPYIAGNNPNKRMMIITGSRETKVTIRKKLERIFKSKYFQDVFYGYGRVEANESRIELPNGFYIYLTTTLSTTPTGTGYNFIVTSDYLSASMIDSKATMSTAMTNWEAFMTRTQPDPPTKLIIDNQRLGFYDLSWRVTKESDDNGEKYVRITMPYQFLEDTNVKLPCGLYLTFKAGEFLTERFSEREKQLILSKTSQETYQVQYLQNPSRDKNKIFQRGYFRFYNPEDLDNTEFNRVFITTDFAFTQKTKADYTVMCCWAEDMDNNLLLLDMQRGKYKGKQLNTNLYNFWHKWQNGVGNTSCSFITIEKVGLGNDQIINDIRHGFYIDDGEQGKKVEINCKIREIPRAGIKKYTRAERSLAYYQQGKIYLPSHTVEINGVNNVMNEIVEPFLREHEEFTDEDHMQRKLHDDIVDNCLDAVSVVNRSRTSYAVEVSTI